MRRASGKPRPAPWSSSKQLAVDIPECLEFQGIARWIEEKQGGLLTGLPFETDVGLNDKLDPVLLQPVCQRLPIVHFQHYAAVWYRNPMTINRVVVSGNMSLRTEGAVEVTDELMTEQVEINPVG